MNVLFLLFVHDYFFSILPPCRFLLHFNRRFLLLTTDVVGGEIIQIFLLAATLPTTSILNFQLLVYHLVCKFLGDGWLIALPANTLCFAQLQRFGCWLLRLRLQDTDLE